MSMIKFINKLIGRTIDESISPVDVNREQQSKSGEIQNNDRDMIFYKNSLVNKNYVLYRDSDKVLE